MLKALELSGFKSFADQTRFEFPRGICAVVGPNGSGKSNLVDAVKWVLGSQSAKSLRGQEMSDVIFNGSASRGPLGTAEVTLTLDNADHQLPVDAREIQVTRRVYRSGEGEYLINRQPCRLRDIRDLLAGTGITTEAYCIIEQGKVDALLQSSPRERRAIFEEAAGISQFKAKKSAAMRRLERVEQNLLRLSDIVDEVESRLRSVRMQAGKARRYRECADRLQQLRTQLGLVDWRALSEQIAARDEQLADLRRRQNEREELLATLESQVLELEESLDACHQRRRAIESAASATREQIAAHQSAIDNLQARRADLQEEIARCSRQLAAMDSRADSTSQQLRDIAAELQSAETELATAEEEIFQHAERLRNSQTALDAERAKLEHSRSEQTEAARAVTILENQLASLRAQASAAAEEHDKLQEQLARLDADLINHTDQCNQLERAEADSASQAQSCETRLAEDEKRLADLRDELARAEKKHRQLEAQLTRNRERAGVLAELEQRLEGLDGGVQEIIRLAREEPDSPWGDVRGVVADLFHVDVDTAPLIEVALGERAQFVVLSSAERLLEHLGRERLGVAGRVGFLRLDARLPVTALDHVDLSAEPGVLGRAARFIETSPEFAPLVGRLLGRTWLVDRLATARRLSKTAGRGLEYVTCDGEFLSADGTLIVGPRTAVVGMLSRRSELRACQEQIAIVEKQLTEHDAVLDRLQREIARREASVFASRAAHGELLAKLAERRQQTTAARVECDHLRQKLEQASRQVETSSERLADVQAGLQSTAARHVAAEQAVGELRAALQSQGEKLSAAQAQVAELQTISTKKQVALAKCEQRVELLRQQLQQTTLDQQERERALEDVRQRLAAREAQLVQHDANVLSVRQKLAELFRRKDQHTAESAEQAAEDEVLRRRRAESATEVREERHQLAALQSQQHRLDVAANKLRHERQTLVERMQDDYGIDLGDAASAAGESEQEASSPEQAENSRTEEQKSRRAEEQPFSRVEDPPWRDGQRSAQQTSNVEHPTPTPPISFDRHAAEREITELRNQINTIGAVNLDALQELEELDSRFQRLSQQYRDLVDAKASLEQIILRIDVDSRQLFVITLETVRGHFQELFRQLFGGGEADIVPDEQEDLLECGIDILARPPGKEACSISLLSGGEKTLTCVALLLAVFRSKPSPFCVLDEVDAALDEANIGRFIEVLREFLSFTQFVVVTHSKKTMSGADTLYGVTMEESGVSKRVAVRFEDVSEDGHIRPSARRAA